VINDGIQAARDDYGSTDTELVRAKLEGSIAGFDACRHRTPAKLKKLLAEAHEKTQGARLRKIGGDDESYWYIRCYELEVEWVCNCVSAALANSGLPVIVPPTARGVMKVAEILGVADE
jgi:hypothetical protein